MGNYYYLRFFFNGVLQKSEIFRVRQKTKKIIKIKKNEKKQQQQQQQQNNVPLDAR